jgi:hypothetical protein
MTIYELSHITVFCDKYNNKSHTSSLLLLFYPLLLKSLFFILTTNTEVS